MREVLLRDGYTSEDPLAAGWIAEVCVERELITLTVGILQAPLNPTSVELTQALDHGGCAVLDPR